MTIVLITIKVLVVEEEVLSLSCVQLFVTPWTAACQAPLSMGFSRQEYWSGWPFPSPGDLPDPGMEPRSPALQGILYCLSPQGSLPFILSLPGHFLTSADTVVQKCGIWQSLLFS